MKTKLTTKKKWKKITKQKNPYKLKSRANQGILSSLYVNCEKRIQWRPWILNGHNIILKISHLNFGLWKTRENQPLVLVRSSLLFRQEGYYYYQLKLFLLLVSIKCCVNKRRICPFAPLSKLKCLLLLPSMIIHVHSMLSKILTSISAIVLFASTGLNPYILCKRLVIEAFTRSKLQLSPSFYRY